MNIEFETPRVFVPLLEPARYKCAHGGRGSGKSYFFVDLGIEDCLSWPGIAGEGMRFLALREHQKSLEHSAKSLFERQLERHGIGEKDGFRIYKSVIETPGDGVIVFQGMKDHTADSVKSYDGFHRAWFEEAQNMSARSLDLLEPTIRWDNPRLSLESQLWFSWNPRRETDPVDVAFRGESPPDDMAIVEANYIDNPFFPEVLKPKIERDRVRDFDKYLHTWLGKYQTISAAVVFKNWEINKFETPDGAVFRFGMDFGFSADPAVVIRCFIIGSNLYIDQESYGKNVKIEKLPSLIGDIYGAERWPIVADSSRPETIDYLKRNGYPRIEASVKGAGSVEDGIEFLQSYDIFVHPRCKETIRELKNYSYKVDKDRLDRDGNPYILPILEDKNNHVIDALRYACEADRRSKNRTISGVRVLGRR